MEIFDMAGEPPDLGRQRSEQRPPQLGLVVDQSEEGVALEDERFRRLDGHDRRRMRRAIEERELPEELPGTEDRDDRRLRALVGWQDDFDRATRDDEQRIARVTLVEDGFGLPESTDAERRCERLDRALVGVAEQPA